ncbi:MAG: STAS domain-containing protein [Verrucomicrobia bacterium]|nr:STAS domain-containing protein [Verrucomicrobiota bacterium]
MNTTAIIAPYELCSTTSLQWKERLTKELSSQQTEVSIDLSKTRFIDSSGLGVLLSLNKTLRAQGGVLKLLNPSSAVAQLIELTRLHRVFEIVHA